MECAIAGCQLNTRNEWSNGRAFDKQPEVGRGQTPSFPLASDSTPTTAGRVRVPRSICFPQNCRGNWQINIRDRFSIIKLYSIARSKWIKYYEVLSTLTEFRNMRLYLSDRILLIDLRSLFSDDLKERSYLFVNWNKTSRWFLLGRSQHPSNWQYAIR